MAPAESKQKREVKVAACDVLGLLVHHRVLRDVDGRRVVHTQHSGARLHVPEIGQQTTQEDRLARPKRPRLDLGMRRVQRD